jgi:diguanylate cyclase (GGDEF)-like protein
MGFPSLDVPTLLVVATIGIAFSGLVLGLASWRDKAARALGYWAAALLVAASGFATMAVGPFSAAAAVLTGDCLLTLSGAFCWAGARVFAGRTVNLGVVLGGPGVLLVFAGLHRAVDVAHVTLTLILVGGYTAAAAETMWRDNGERLRSRQAAVMLLVFHAAFQFARAMLGLVGLGFYRAHVHDIYAAVFLEALLFAIGISTVLLATMKEQTAFRSTLHLRHMTMADELTGLGNRRQFEDSLARETRRAARVRQPLALLMIDVDHFKMYNDTYGHLPGDDCLRAIAGAIRRVARRPGDVATRFGGEEFAVLLTATDEVGAMDAATQIHASLAALRITHATSPYGMLTVSVGVAAYLPELPADAPDALVRQADWALYVAKSEGRNATRAASESRDSGVLRPTA